MKVDKIERKETENAIPHEGRINPIQDVHALEPNLCLRSPGHP